MKVKEYYITHSSSSMALYQAVDKFIQDGWQPQGGMAVTIDLNGEETFYQALVKYEEPHA